MTPGATAKQESLSTILQGLSRVGDCEGSALISRDGIIVAADLPADFDRDTFSAMSATMVAAAETATLELSRGVPARVIVETQDVKVVAMGASSETVLVTLAKPRSNVGLLLTEMGKAVRRVRSVVGE